MQSQDKDLSSELSSILAHEIKNPMNSIIINMEVLRSALFEVTQGIDSPASRRAKKYLDVIEDEIRRLDRVMKGFLEFTKPHQSSKAHFQLNEIIVNLMDFMANEMKLKNISAKLELNSSLPLIFGNADQIREALLNLMINALQAMPQGGTITLRSFVKEHYICIGLRDTGTGIDDRDRENIFNPYFTTKAKGSGLGLTVVRRVMKEHQGEIQMQSAIGSGTEFTLCFPKGDA